MNAKFLNQIYEAMVLLYGVINSQDIAKILRKMKIKITKKEIDADLKNKFFAHFMAFNIYKLDDDELIIADSGITLAGVLEIEAFKNPTESYFIPTTDINEFLHYFDDANFMHDNKVFLNELVHMLHDKGIDSVAITYLLERIRFVTPNEDLVADFVEEGIFDESFLDDEKFNDKLIEVIATTRRACFKGFTFEESIKNLPKNEKDRVLKDVIKHIIADFAEKEKFDVDIDELVESFDIENKTEAECIDFINTIVKKEKLPEA